ncbi:MAG TPA: plasmid recombination protein [Tissierellaceae bacterium]|nr:plasmid recombination protein [Tissierellaceae bacterium]
MTRRQSPMNSLSASLVKSTTKTNIKHNNRELTKNEMRTNKHIDESKSDNNIFLKQRDIKEVYQEQFSEALQKYNNKQRRKDRKIDDYFEHISNSKKTMVQQEMIVQLGTKDDFRYEEDREKVKGILEDYYHGFVERNPQLIIYNAVIHDDEATPHLHINFVPVAHDYKRGLESQVAFDRALLQQDPELNKDRPFNEWRLNEVEALETLMQEHDIERELVGTNNYADVNTYKHHKRLEEEVAKTEKKLEAKQEELKSYVLEDKSNEKLKGIRVKKEIIDVEVETDEKNIFGQNKTETVKEWTGNLIVSEEDFLRMKETIRIASRNEKQLIKILESDVHRENARLKESNTKLRSENNELINDYNSLVDGYNSLQEENKALKAYIGDLRREIGLIYESAKEFLKERTSDLRAFKSAFKDLVDIITGKINKTDLENNFQKEYNKENRKQRSHDMSL